MVMLMSGKEVLNYTADELYEMLLQQKEQNGNNNQPSQDENKEGQGSGQDNQPSSNNEQQKKNDEDEQDLKQDENKEGQESGQDNQPSSNNEQQKKNDEDEQDSKQDEENNGNKDGDKEETMCDDHSLWEEAFNNKDKTDETNEENREQEQSKKQHDKENKAFQDEFDERKEFEENRKEKRKEARERVLKDIKQCWGMNSGSEKRDNLKNIGKATHNVDWRSLLREAAESNLIMWGKRRAIAENNYAARLEEIEPEIKTEVMIDVSGSVDEELVKAFLRETKSIFTQLQTGSDLDLKVGFFDTRFFDFVKIKTTRDIDNLGIPGRGGTDLDLPVRSFSKDKDINKIIFTDGYGLMPKEDLKNENVIWLIYGNENFKPCCGRVININEKQLKNMRKQYEQYER